MCGISGWFSVAPDESAAPRIHEIVQSQNHRGPDFRAIEEVACPHAYCVLGHNRLSIIDLSSDANQPIYDADGQVCLVFNGEIYNYLEIREELAALGRQFRTQSDTEVLLQAYLEWGTDALARVNGMFAFGLVDRKKSLLWLVRDRFGVKPLYVKRDGDSVWFASTGKVLARQHGCGPNWNYLFKGVTTWNFDDDSTESQYDDLEMMPPGGMWVCEVKDGQMTIAASRWYDLEGRVMRSREEIAALSASQTVALLLDTFESACTFRLRADVPVAVALSGGLDSGSVACMVGKTLGHHDVTGFSFGDPADHSTEGPLAELLGRAAGIRTVFILPSQKAVASAFEATLEAQDAPFVSVSQVAQYMVSQAVKKEGYTVLLGGQGGDEAFMGYRKYFLFVLKELASRREFGRFMGLAMGLLSVGWAERGQFSNYRRHLKRFQSTSDGGVLGFPDSLEKPELSMGGGREPWRRQMLDVTRFSLPTLLRYEDRNSMAHSIETRLPFLDYRMIELGLALPNDLKVRNGFGKWALREAMKGLVPDEVRLARYKIGFAVDQGSLLREGLGDTLRGWIRQDLAKAKSFTRPAFDLDRDFSDDVLARSVRAMPELLSLAWMLRRF